MNEASSNRSSEAAPGAAATRNPVQPQQPAGLPIDWSTEPAPAYANGAHVVHTPREFAVVFDDTAPFPGRLAPREDPQGTRGRIVSSLRVSPDAFFQIVCALASSWNRFAATFLDPRMPRPRFVLADAGNARLDAQDPQEPPGRADEAPAAQG